MRFVNTIVKKLNERDYNIFLFTIILLIIFSLSIIFRHQQLVVWEKEPDIFFVDKTPMMTTLDAPYWIRIAKEHKEGNLNKKKGLRNYPEGKERYIKKFNEDLKIPNEFKDEIESQTKNNSKSQIRYDAIPLLSFLISKMSKFLDYNYYLTGTLMIPTFASLFMIPLGIYFFKIRIPLSGLLGGLIGTFSSAYYARSSIGRIDTDMLNLFFPSLISLMILMSSKSKSERSIIIFAMFAGLSMFFFQWWYSREGFSILFFICLVFSLCFQKIRIRTILISTFLFILCAHPKTFLGGTENIESFLRTYLVIEEASPKTISENINSRATFPNVFKTISEADKVKFNEVLMRIVSDNTIVWIGFVSFLILALLRWKDCLPLAPLILLGMLSFQSSNRFIMFLAPLIGIGLGWIITIIFEGFFLFFERWRINSKKNSLSSQPTNQINLKQKNILFNKTINNKKILRFFPQILLYLGMGAFFWTISSKTAISFVPLPSINTNVYKTFFEVKKRVPSNSAILTWWDYGYAITEATRLSTFHDGGSQFSPKTYFIARSFTSNDQYELHKIAQFLSTEGNKGIAKYNSSPQSLLKEVLNPKNNPWDPVYIFYTADMTRKFGAISRIGSWDIEKGGSKPIGYQNLACNKINSEEMRCQGAKIDLIKGKINNKPILHRIIFIRNGEILREKSFDNSGGYTLQIIVVGNRIVEVQFIDELVFHSNYNQMFMLGLYKKDLFQEIYNAYPFSRLYKIKF